MLLGSVEIDFSVPMAPRPSERPDVSQKADEVSGVIRTIELTDPILSGLGFGSGWVATIATDDPDILLEALIE
jgi:hypothetical protein